MLKEALMEVEKLCSDRLTPSVLALDGGNPLVNYVWNPATHAIEQVAKLPPARQHKVETLDSFKAAFDSYADGGSEESDGNSTVWVGSNRKDSVSALLIIDDGGGEARRNRVLWQFGLSPLFLLLDNMPTEQKPLYRALRHDLRSAGITPENFAQAVSKLKWTTTTTAAGEFGTMKSTLARTSDSELTAVIDLPPELMVEFDPVPLLSGHPEWDLTVKIECSVVVEPEDEEIHITPFPGEMSKALDATVDKLRQVLIKVLGVTPKAVLAGWAEYK